MGLAAIVQVVDSGHCRRTRSIKPIHIDQPLVNQVILKLSSKEMVPNLRTTKIMHHQQSTFILKATNIPILNLIVSCIEAVTSQIRAAMKLRYMR